MKVRNSKKPSLLDKQIGKKIRYLRRKKGISQYDLSASFSTLTHPQTLPCSTLSDPQTLPCPTLSYQQIQKYERGLNRISVNYLKRISILLDVPISYFFDESKDNNTKAMTTKESRLLNTLVESMQKIKSERKRILLLKFIKDLANIDEEDHVE